MGYNTRRKGSIRIEPPLTAVELRQIDKRFLGEGGADCIIVGKTEKVETDEGFLTKMYGLSIEPITDEEYKGYDFISDLQQIVETYSDHEFVGHIRCEGEDSGDIYRLYVEDGLVITDRAKLVWSDGTVEGI